MDDLVVDSHLETIVVDDEDADRATSVVEGLAKTGSKTALVKDGETLLDVASLSHGNNATILTDVKNAVLLEDRTKHVLDNDRGSRVGNEAGLLMELLGEEVNTEVTVLASLRGGGDADDLARAALEDQEIANADVVAGDGDGVSGSHLACGCGGGRNVRSNWVSWSADTDRPLDRGTGRDGAAGKGSGNGRHVRRRVRRGGRYVRRSTGSVLLLDNDLFLIVGVLVTGVGVRVRVVVVTVRVDRVGYTLSDLVGDFVGSVGDTVTERVVLTFVVVISHGQTVMLGSVGSGTSRRVYSNLRITSVDGVLVLGSEGLAGNTRIFDDRAGALTELALGNVNLGGCVVGSRAVDSIEVSVVGTILDVDVGVGVDVRRLGREADERREGQLWAGKRR